MKRLQVDPDALDVAALQIKQATAGIDGIRLDVAAASPAYGNGLGERGTPAAANDLSAALGAFFIAARDELAAMSEFANVAAGSYRAADQSLRPGPR